MNRIARCCCQDCSAAVSGAPAINVVCHCASCQRRTGSAFGWSAYFAESAVETIEGAYLSYARSDADIPYERFFCARCGTTLYWRTPGFLPGHIGFAGGCFDETPLPEPTMSARDDQRCAWLTLPETWIRTP